MNSFNMKEIYFLAIALTRAVTNYVPSTFLIALGEKKVTKFRAGLDDSRKKEVDKKIFAKKKLEDNSGIVNTI